MIFGYLGMVQEPPIDGDDSGMVYVSFGDGFVSLWHGNWWEGNGNWFGVISHELMIWR